MYIYNTVEFVFNIYDTDGSGVIDKEETIQMISDLYGSKFDKNFHAKR
jgi:Ca2+-binding EF-hand superfamily protein